MLLVRFLLFQLSAFEVNEPRPLFVFLFPSALTSPALHKGATFCKGGEKTLSFTHKESKLNVPLAYLCVEEGNERCPCSMETPHSFRLPTNLRRENSFMNMQTSYSRWLPHFELRNRQCTISNGLLSLLKFRARSWPTQTAPK